MDARDASDDVRRVFSGRHLPVKEWRHNDRAAAKKFVKRILSQCYGFFGFRNYPLCSIFATKFELIFHLQIAFFVEFMDLTVRAKKQYPGYAQAHGRRCLRPLVRRQHCVKLPPVHSWLYRFQQCLVTFLSQFRAGLLFLRPSRARPEQASCHTQGKACCENSDGRRGMHKVFRKVQSQTPTSLALGKGYG